jgi:hypothetical protein
MAAVVPPVIIVLDLSTLSASSTREWLGFSRVGTCYVPKVIQEEMRFLHDRAPDPDLERVARDFQRFYRTSGWKISDAIAHHPSLRSSTGESLTKRVRISLAVARCAYGLAEDNPNSLVVLSASDRTLLQRIYDMKVPNLCAINGPTLLQWSQSGQRPIAVVQKMQHMRLSPSMARPNIESYRTSTAPPLTQVQENTRIQSFSSIHSPSKAKFVHTPSSPNWLPELISGISALLALGVAGMIAWMLYLRIKADQTNPQSTQTMDPDVVAIAQTTHNISPFLEKISES